MSVYKWSVWFSIYYNKVWELSPCYMRLNYDDTDILAEAASFPYHFHSFSIFFLLKMMVCLWDEWCGCCCCCYSDVTWLLWCICVCSALMLQEVLPMQFRIHQYMVRHMNFMGKSAACLYILNTDCIKEHMCKFSKYLYSFLQVILLVIC